MIVVHHLNNSRSQRVLWLLEELALPYDIVRYERDTRTMLAPPSLRAVHPLGKSPVITDGDKTIAETGAIIEYILGAYGQGRLIPAEGTPERLAYSYWLHYAEGSAMPPLVMALVFSRIADAPMPALLRPLARRIARQVQVGYVGPNVARHLAFIDDRLGRSEWFAGPDFTAVDIMMSFPCETGLRRGNGAQPAIAAFVARIHARPAYTAALKKGGPYAYA